MFGGSSLRSADDVLHDEDAWTGGDYDLSVDLGRRSDEDLDAAIRALWAHPALYGVWRDPLGPWDESSRVPAGLPDHQASGCAGVATLPDGHRVVCRTYVCRFEPSPDVLGFSIPITSLRGVDHLGSYPFNVDDTRDWEVRLAGWLVEIARWVHARVPFPLALTGYDVFAEVRAEDITRDGIPSDRWMGYLWTSNGRLEWFPPTHWEGPARI